jgi:hypothetical protein
MRTARDAVMRLESAQTPVWNLRCAIVPKLHHVAGTRQGSVREARGGVEGEAGMTDRKPDPPRYEIGQRVPMPGRKLVIRPPYQQGYRLSMRKRP